MRSLQTLRPTMERSPAGPTPDPMELAFLVGLLSALHCFGMCGGIVGSLTLSLQPERSRHTPSLLRFLLAYNGGRILSYTLAGGLVGLLGEGLLGLLPQMGGTLLRLLFLVSVIILGFLVTGWYPRLGLVERLGQPLWNRLQSLRAALLPIHRTHQALLLGMVWGWLPCGLVYYALLMALSQHSATQAALFMFSFGIGTLAPMLATGLVAGRVAALRNSTPLRTLSGLLLILLGVTGLLMTLFPQVRHAIPMYPG